LSSVGQSPLGSGISATIAVAADDALADPAPLLAVTDTRIVDPTSEAVSRYVVPVAEAMSVHAAPEASQRRHCLAYVIGVVPLQLPVVVERVSPS
jgi:hypothetical protein